MARIPLSQEEMLGIPPPPPTPGPLPVSHAVSTAKQRFGGVIWMPKTGAVPTHFRDYDHYEVYSETTSYSSRVYQAAYKGQMRSYVNCLFILDDNGKEEHYVVARRQPTELEELEPYCPCSTCTALPCNPLKYLWCPQCTGCIKAGQGFAREEHIAVAKQRREQRRTAAEQPMNKYWGYLQRYSWVTAVEVGTALGLTALVWYGC